MQFLSKDQIRQVCKVSDELNIPAMCYGIRTDFQGKLFEGSSELLALADNLIELKTVCDCGEKQSWLFAWTKREKWSRMETKLKLVVTTPIKYFVENILEN